ncbi:MAG: hypothetical protein WAW39_07800 [Prosthecobacter sp.]|uniref:type II toxin-antitoxin system RelE/ParE family toxin n=1 Tax=Prosthecobacter sp. TaxID=1965333 RepID=UPI003BB02761
MKQIRILPEVWDDIDDAAAWHDRVGGRDLSRRFVAAFRSQLPEILRFTGTHRLIYKQFSRVFAKPFPYAIYFRIQDDWVVVTLLWHTAKNPEDLRSTLSERDPGNQ